MAWNMITKREKNFNYTAYNKRKGLKMWCQNMTKTQKRTQKHH